MTYNHHASEVTLRAAITNCTASDLNALTGSQPTAATNSTGNTDTATLLPNAPIATAECPSCRCCTCIWM